VVYATPIILTNFLVFWVMQINTIPKYFSQPTRRAENGHGEMQLWRTVMQCLTARTYSVKHASRWFCHLGWSLNVVAVYHQETRAHEIYEAWQFSISPWSYRTTTTCSVCCWWNVIYSHLCTTFKFKVLKTLWEIILAMSIKLIMCISISQ
jgi:hypothetical protein